MRIERVCGYHDADFAKLYPETPTGSVFREPDIGIVRMSWLTRSHVAMV